MNSAVFSLALLSIILSSTFASWHGKFRSLKDDETKNCRIWLDPHIMSIDKGHLGEEVCDIITDHPYPCFEGEGITINCLFDFAKPGYTTLFYSI